MDALLTFAEWTGWSWLFGSLQKIEMWLSAPERAPGLTAVGLVVIGTALVAFFLTGRWFLDVLAAAWVGLVLLAQVGNPVWAWLLILTATAVTILILMSLVIAWASPRRNRYAIGPWEEVRIELGHFTLEFWTAGLMGVVSPLVAALSHFRWRAVGKRSSGQREVTQRKPDQEPLDHYVLIDPHAQDPAARWSGEQRDQLRVDKVLRAAVSAEQRRVAASRRATSTLSLFAVMLGIVGAILAILAGAVGQVRVSSLVVWAGSALLSVASAVLISALDARLRQLKRKPAIQVSNSSEISALPFAPLVSDFQRLQRQFDGVTRPRTEDD